MSKNTENPASFEQTLSELEALVNRMEGGEMSLEESLSAFQHGMALTQNCQKALNEAEQKIEILTNNGPDAQPEPFEADH